LWQASFGGLRWKRLTLDRLLLSPNGAYLIWYNAIYVGILPTRVSKEVKQMAKEKAPKRIDISSMPELLSIAQEVRRTNESRILQQESEDLVILSPAVPKQRAKAKAQPVTSDDALFRLIGIGKSGIPGGVSGKKHEYLARAYRPR
jgi:hypothetical protein